jgi:hypothetical protein
MPNPVTPITHHWLDSSHITHGLVTTGVSNPRWKAELSVFNGREPDEERADLDLDAFDSLSGRITFMPTPRWVMQVSAAHLNEAEQEFASQPRTDVDRFTASAIYHRTSPTKMWATTFAYGVNASTEILPGAVADLVSHAGLVESHLSIRDRHSWFGRLELVGKPGHDLHVHEAPAEIFVVSKLQAGYAYYVGPWKGMALGIGATGSLSFVPEFLASRYEGRVAPGMGVFLNVRPGRHVH